MKLIAVHVSLKMLLPILALLLCSFANAGREDRDGRIATAMCQSSCLGKFVSFPPTDEKCLAQDQRCDMCWKMCEKLNTAPNAWSYVCDSTDEKICPPGCRSACDFTKETVAGRPSPTSFHPVPVFEAVGDLQLIVSWSRPALAESGHKLFLVYLLLWTHSSSPQWSYLLTTAKEEATVDGAHYEFSNVKFELLAISESGVEASTHPVYPPPGYKPPKTEAGTDEYDYYDYVDIPVAPAGTKPSRSPSSHLNPDAPPAVMPDLQITVTTDTVGDVVQALVSWQQPAAIRPTSYELQWNRDTCRVGSTLCDLPSEFFETTVVATSAKTMLFKLTSLTFNAKYWVEVRIDGLLSQRVHFYSPRCERLPDRPVLRCPSPTTTAASGRGYGVPADVNASRLTVSSSHATLTSYVTIGVCLVVAVMVGAVVVVTIKKHDQLRVLLVAKAELIRSRTSSLRGSLKGSLRGSFRRPGGFRRKVPQTDDLSAMETQLPGLLVHAIATKTVTSLARPDCVSVTDEKCRKASTSSDPCSTVSTSEAEVGFNSSTDESCKVGVE